MTDPISQPGFNDLGLPEPLMRALSDVGYESPTPIQAQTVPLLLAGHDVIGQAQTGTGKTAAFALPLLARMDTSNHATQVLVLAPTRELAIQVAEAFHKYAKHYSGVHVVPIYGGQDYNIQLRALKRGVQVVVGTPGRVMDHMNRGTLVLDQLKCLVLDEADEMLRMGFIDDVEWILEQTPKGRQIALFSATMPPAIRRIANTHLQNPQEVTIQLKTSTAATIHQRYWPVHNERKIDALTRILEAEPVEAALVFVRTKTATVEVAEKLEARGLAVAALNSDMAQRQREKTIDGLKSGKLDVVVATDVAARGLDVDRVSHVINFDIPNDTESYVHRVGRTGRAGKKGDAILFVTPRERRLLQTIERAVGQPIEMMELPSTETINEQRISRFKQRITEALGNGESTLFRGILEQYRAENDVDPIDMAAALASLLQGETPLLLNEPDLIPAGGAKPGRGVRVEPPVRPRAGMNEGPERRGGRPSPSRAADFPTDLRFEPAPAMERKHERFAERPVEPHRDRPVRDRVAVAPPDVDMERFRVEVGYAHGVKPGNIVGAIANEVGIDSEFIGRITIFDDHSLVDLPVGMPTEVFHSLRAVRVSGHRLNISRIEDERRPTRSTENVGFRPKKKSTSDGKNKGKSKHRAA